MVKETNNEVRVGRISIGIKRITTIDWEENGAVARQCKSKASLHFKRVTTLPFYCKNS